MQLVANNKQNILNVMHSLPEDGSIEDAMERLFLLRKVEKGCQQADDKQTISHKNAKQKMQAWLS
ncbi:hypothetical protein SPONN_531 [uncultured Candidatus Thioglobus sp.]|nr:hypothetical protein SPONN_531 [uncultured Candidatus Thioglobus sp.]